MIKFLIVILIFVIFFTIGYQFGQDSVRTNSKIKTWDSSWQAPKELTI
jgi:hypothetical protein